MNYLQSQINPHFLFNTLNSIGTLADIEDAKQTKMMLESLSELLRYNLKKINDIVTLEDEFNIIKNYIYIQMIRFGNKIQYNIHMDESVKDFMVPSMILQPFVENAMIHGLEQKEGKGHLTVEIKDESDHINILIKDDGIGMTQEQAESLLKYEDEIILNKNYTKGMGVCNVVKRLVLYFGENIVSIESGIAKGTSTTIKIPKESL
ncbi:sensor histidine kinase [Vallitalea guaymasensis]|uniref:sensor histidine kinase n=1 Tax=Vallitalea guaymasensis TaxID=1185412 RepID=UPI00187D2884|nr:sensor histidine kinase [Vallitalea guaymasensis]